MFFFVFAFCLMTVLMAHGLANVFMLSGNPSYNAGLLEYVASVDSVYLHQ
jgi:hypothetical protein